MSSAASLEPIVKTLELNASIEKAFRHFTDNIHVWWPLTNHSLSGENAVSVVLEAAPGGRIYEIDKAGKKREWGRVLECEPSTRLVFSWVLEAPEKATEVEVQFRELGEDRSSMTLTHRGWDKRADGEEWRGNYHKGWDGVLAAYHNNFA